MTSTTTALREAHEHDCCSMPASAFTVGRRKFVKLAALGAGVALFGSFAAKTAWASGAAEAVVLTCMDFRLVDKTVKYLDSLDHMQGEYDHIVLAGASLSVVTDKFPAWATTFWDHVKIAIDLHHVKEVIVLDHRDCGAYKLVYGKDLGASPKEETDIHTANLKKIFKVLKEKYPHIEVRLALMALDGTVDHIKAS